jgi:hypothetical protein
MVPKSPKITYLEHFLFALESGRIPKELSMHAEALFDGPA